jgi:hypothetical protein
VSANAGENCDGRLAARDAERLWCGSAILLSGVGEPATRAAVMGVACSAPCGAAGDAPGRCSLCARLLMGLEGLARGGEAYRVFEALAAYFLDDLPEWGPERRAAAEDALAAMLDEDRRRSA